MMTHFTDETCLQSSKTLKKSELPLQQTPESFQTNTITGYSSLED